MHRKGGRGGLSCMTLQKKTQVRSAITVIVNSLHHATDLWRESLLFGWPCCMKKSQDSNCLGDLLVPKPFLQF